MRRRKICWSNIMLIPHRTYFSGETGRKREDENAFRFFIFPAGEKELFEIIAFFRMMW